MKRTKFPNDSEINEMREKLSGLPGSKSLIENASPVEKAKFLICQEIVLYKNNHQLSQRQLADQLNEDESLVSKIVHYHITEFTIDRLMKFLNVLNPKAELSLTVAS